MSVFLFEFDFCKLFDYQYKLSKANIHFLNHLKQDTSRNSESIVGTIEILGSLLQNPAFSVLGLVDANGLIDVDAAVSALKETAKKRGKLEIDLPYFGRFRFDENDFDKLREYIGNSQA